MKLVAIERGVVLDVGITFPSEIRESSELEL